MSRQIQKAMQTEIDVTKKHLFTTSPLCAQFHLNKNIRQEIPNKMPECSLICLVAIGCYSFPDKQRIERVLGSRHQARSLQKCRLAHGAFPTLTESDRNNPEQSQFQALLSACRRSHRRILPFCLALTAYHLRARYLCNCIS